MSLTPQQQQIAQKGNELNFYSQFKTRFVPSNACQTTKVIGLGSNWTKGGVNSLVSGVRSTPYLPCLTNNANKRVLTSNISTDPAANGEQFLGFGYYQTAQDGNIYV
jgi:hypothetical protein